LEGVMIAAERDLNDVFEKLQASLRDLWDKLQRLGRNWFLGEGTLL
jgi:hypothetical protein